jgi:hypothetical protein
MESTRWLDKTAWGSGPWQHEPDRVEWRAQGLPCLMLRHPHHGHWCGYVGVPPGHPWHGVEASEIAVDVHGGLNFADACTHDERPPRERICHVPEAGESDAVWWLGFDCLHAFDYAPGMAARERELVERHPSLSPLLGPPSEGGRYGVTYRDLFYVRSQTEWLAAQCAAAVVAFGNDPDVAP